MERAASAAERPIPSHVLERPYTVGRGGGYPPWSPPSPPPPPLPMFEADSQDFASAPSVPRGFTLQNSRPAFDGDHRGTLGGGGVPANPPPPLQTPPPPPFEYIPGAIPTPAGLGGGHHHGLQPQQHQERGAALLRRGPPLPHRLHPVPLPPDPPLPGRHLLRHRNGMRCAQGVAKRGMRVWQPWGVLRCPVPEGGGGLGMSGPCPDGEMPEDVLCSPCLGPDLLLASTSPDVIGWSRILPSHTPDAARSY